MFRIAATGLLIALVSSGCGTSTQYAQTNPPPAGSSEKPSIVSISPTSAMVGSPGLTLAITGSNLIPTPGHGPGPQAVWVANSIRTKLATTVITSSQLTAVIPAALFGSPVTAQVFVESGGTN